MTRKVMTNSYVLHVLGSLREEVPVIRDGVGEWLGGKFSCVGKEGKLDFNLQSLGKRKNQNIS